MTPNLTLIAGFAAGAPLSAAACFVLLDSVIGRIARRHEQRRPIR